MYTYEIYYLNRKNEKMVNKWNCCCNDYDTTLRMAKGACDRLDASFGIIIIKRDGNINRIEVFDEVLN